MSEPQFLTNGEFEKYPELPIGDPDKRLRYRDTEGDNFWIDESGTPQTDCPSSHMEFGKFSEYCAYLAWWVRELGP